MKNMEFKSWFDYTKNLFPEFTIANQSVRDLWQRVLGGYSLEEAKNAVMIYASESKTGFPPKAGQIKEILRNNKKVERPAEIKQLADYPEKRFHEDIVLGICHHNLYVYRDAYKLVKENPQIDFKQALIDCCMKRCGRAYEFPSDEELVTAGISPKEKYPLTETLGLYELYVRKQTL